MTPVEWLLIVAVLLFVHPFLIYPVVARFLPSRREMAGEVDASAPEVAMVICALNEERVIRAKLENTFELEYPAGRLTPYLVNDGSTDGTASIGREFVSRGLQLIDREKRRGKVANLNEVIAGLRQEIVVLSDANVMYDRAAVRRLVARFADPAVGCVSGKVILTDTTDALKGSEEDYYSVEWMLQQKASDVYAMCGADGAMYAFRRKLFKPCPNDTIIEDFVLPMQIVRQGYRVVFECKALAWEQGVTSLQEEFKRKVRIAAGAAQALLRRNGTPANAPAGFWFVWISHKLLRWMSPLMWIAMIVLSVLAFGTWFGKIVLAATALLWLLAALRWMLGKGGTVLDAPFYFVFAQIAVAAGLWRGFRGTQTVLWEKANR